MVRGGARSIANRPDFHANHDPIAIGLDLICDMNRLDMMHGHAAAAHEVPQAVASSTPVASAPRTVRGLHGPARVQAHLHALHHLTLHLTLPSPYPPSRRRPPRQHHTRSARRERPPRSVCPRIAQAFACTCSSCSSLDDVRCDSLLAALEAEPCSCIPTSSRGHVFNCPPLSSAVFLVSRIPRIHALL